MKLKPRVALLLSIAVSLITVAASAFELSPMEQEFGNRPEQSSRTFYVINEDSVAVAVQLKAVARTNRTDGSEIRTPTNDFVIYPQQVMLGPNEKRAVRVTYRGAKPHGREASYRLIAEQLPVNAATVNSSGNVQIKYLMNFVASMYVSPEGVQPKVTVESLSSFNSAQGQILQMNLVNNGGRHKVLKGVKVILRSGQTEVELDPQSLKALDTINLLAGEKISVGVPYPTNLPAGPVIAELQFLD